MLVSLSHEFPIALTTYCFFNHNVIAKKLIFWIDYLEFQLLECLNITICDILPTPYCCLYVMHGGQTIPPAYATERLSKIMQQCYEIVLKLRHHSNKYPCQPG